MQEDANKKVATYINQMNNYDPDLQEMGAKYLSEMVQSGRLNLKEDPKLARQITENFLKQVASMNFVVHSSAIRQLADMVPFIPKDELVHIFHETISAIAKVNTPAPRREVFSTSAGTMIHHAPQELGIVISDLFVQSINQLLKAKSVNTDIEMLLLNVITQFARKWPNVAGYSHIKYDRQALLLHLLDNIQNSSKLLLVRKSDGALSKLCITFNKQIFELLFNDKKHGLLSYVRKNLESTDEEYLKNLRNGILTISNISKVHNPEMRPWVGEICNLALQIIHFHKDKDTYIELETEVIESAITTLTYLLKGYSSQISKFMLGGGLQNFIEECLNFDLQGMMTYVSEEMDIEEDEDMDEDYFNDDSICWKVRAAILKYISVLMHKDKVFKDNKAKQQGFLQILTSKLTQQNQNVSRKAFECFNYIIESISVAKDITDGEEDLQLKKIKSSESDFAIDLIKQISNQIQLLFKNKKTKEQVKTQASKTLLRIVELLKDKIKDHEDVNIKLMKLIMNLIHQVKTESSVNLIGALKYIMPPSLETKFDLIEKCIDELLNFTKNKNFRVVASSFGTLRVIIRTYPHRLIKSAKINDILRAILEKLQENDADKSIKSAVIKCLGPIYGKLFDHLQQKQQIDIFQATEKKLRVQIDKGLILHQISLLNQNYQFKASEKAVLEKILKEASTSLGSANFELNSYAVECCGRLIQVLVSKLQDNTVADILDRSRPMINDHKIPKYVDFLLEHHPKCFKNFAEIIVRTTDAFYVVKLVDKKIIKRQECISILKTIAKPDNSKNISIILSKLLQSEKQLISFIGNNDHWGLICIGALGYLGNQKTSEYLLKLLKSENDEVKLEAAKALGNVASRFPALVPAILDLATKTQDNYLYIVSLKQTLCFSQKQFAGLSNVIEFMLKKSEESDRETYQYIISESIGRAALISERSLEKLLKASKDMSSARLFILASALRYSLETLQNDHELNFEMENFLREVAQLTYHKDVNVRCAALKSLNSAVQNFSKDIKLIINESFIEQLLDNMQIKQELIVIIDYGVNKEKKDLGRPLRIQAFNFMKAILEYPKLEPYTQFIVSKCLDKIKEETSNDLILKRVHIIKKICEKDFTAFIPHQNQFSKAFGLQEGVLKPHQKQSQADDERNQGYLKNLLKEIIAIRKISDREGSDVVKGLINNVKSSDRLNKIIESLERDN